YRSRGTDAEGERTDRRARHLPPGSPLVSPTSRLNLCKTSPRRPSSPLRMYGCSTSCVNRCSSRQPPPTCSRSSAARPSISKPCSTRWSNQPPDFARRMRRRSLLRNAVRICGAKYGMLSLCKGEEAWSVAMYGVEPALVEKLQGKLRRPGPNTAAGRLMRTKTVVPIADVRTEPGFFDTPPGFAGPQLAMHAGARTLLAVPMLKESELVGYIIIYRQEPEPFTEKHIELVTN